MERGRKEGRQVRRKEGKERGREGRKDGKERRKEGWQESGSEECKDMRGMKIVLK